MTSAADIDFDSIHLADAEMDAEDFLTAGMDAPSEPEAETFLGANADQPSTDVIGPKQQSAKSKAYEKKSKKVLSRAFHFTVSNEALHADGAAILVHEKRLSRAAGDLAAENETFARTLDFLTEGSENATAAFIIAAAPFAFQLIRNHEQFFEPKPRGGIKIPFTKGRRMFGGFRLGIRLGKWRAATDDPDYLKQQTFGNPGVQRALVKAGLMEDPNRGRTRR